MITTQIFDLSRLLTKPLHQMMLQKSGQIQPRTIVHSTSKKGKMKKGRVMVRQQMVTAKRPHNCISILLWLISMLLVMLLHSLQALTIMLILMLPLLPAPTIQVARDIYDNGFSRWCITSNVFSVFFPNLEFNVLMCDTCLCFL